MLAGDIAYGYLCVMASCLPILYILYMFLSALQGWGDTVRPMISGIVELAARIGVAAVVAYTGYKTGIFYAEVVAWTGAVLYLGYHCYKWIKKETNK